jgi:diacylglycerol kinase family enzyme
VTRIVVVANPVASQFTGGGHRDVMSVLAASSEAEALWPSSATEASAVAAAAVEDGVDIVVAMGGDGMVHHVAQALIGSGSALGIIPVGTTNVIARLLQIPSRPTRAAKLIAAQPFPSQVGVARLNARRGSLETVHHAIFACGLGLDAEVVTRADSEPYRKYRFGSIHYARTTLGVAMGSFASRKPHVEMRVRGQTSMVSTALLQFRDVYTYFGKIPLRLGPDRPDPMTLLTLDRMRRGRIPQIGFDVILGRDLEKVKGMSIHQGVERVEFVADPPVAIQADGESLGVVDSGEITWLPGSLRAIAGPGYGD